MIYRITHIDPSYKGTVEPDDLTGLQFKDVTSVTDEYVPISGTEGEPISFWNEETQTWDAA
tara:strand:- start:615 stop:797 length:183 start_codon:yes stop_codon:yes gene_type:complete